MIVTHESRTSLTAIVPGQGISWSDGCLVRYENLVILHLSQCVLGLRQYFIVNTYIVDNQSICSYSRGVEP
jgi:hypothetical protein